MEKTKKARVEAGDGNGVDEKHAEFVEKFRALQDRLDKVCKRLFSKDSTIDSMLSALLSCSSRRFIIDPFSESRDCRYVFNVHPQL